jgi:hypothetical protein
MDANNISPYSLAYKMIYQDKLENEYFKNMQLGSQIRNVKM